MDVRGSYLVKCEVVYSYSLVSTGVGIKKLSGGYDRTTTPVSFRSSFGSNLYHPQLFYPGIAVFVLNFYLGQE